MMRILKIFILVTCFGLISDLHAQQNRGGIPVSMQTPTSLSQLKSGLNPFILPTINNLIEQQRADSISKAKCSGCQNKYYGKGINVSIDLKSQSKFVVIGDTIKVWLLKLQSSSAYGMQFYFDRFKLPEGGKLFVYNEDKSMVLGAFTSDNNPVDQTKFIKFGTQHIVGNEIYIEYSEPNIVDFNAELSIAKVIHIFDETVSFSGPFGSSQYCNINVACPEGDGWQKEINSVALILAHDNANELSAMCSGALVNNTKQDGKSLFLTANHCVDGDVANDKRLDYSTWLFIFNHQTVGCNSDGSDIQRDITTHSVYGSTLLSKDGVGSPTSDYLLLNLNASSYFLASYGVCYAGWNKGGSQGPFTGIHHPAGDVKKISVANTLYQEIPNKIELIFDKGTVQRGSSGSPIFDFNHKIIGQLYYGRNFDGFNFCSPNLIAGYGKFSTSWQNGRFSQWLDPEQTFQTAINTYCPVFVNNGGVTPPKTCSGDGSLKNGFYINGKKQKVVEVCLENDIVIKNSTGMFCPNTSIISGKECRDNKEDAYSCYSGISCNCHIARLFISMTLCDDKLNPVDVEYSKWQAFKMPDLELTSETFSDVSVKISSFNLKNYLPSPYIKLYSGQTYRVKIARTNVFGWEEYTSYIHLYSANRSVDGQSVDFDLYGKDITISNSVVSGAEKIVASNSIRILPSSNLKSGRYYISTVSDCSTMTKSLNEPQFNDSHTKYNGYQTMYTSGYESSSNTEDLPEDNITIYPNPTKNELNISLVTSYELINIKLYTVTGVEMLNENYYNKKQIKLSLNELTSGVYFIKVFTGAEQKVFKILKE